MGYNRNSTPLVLHHQVLWSSANDTKYMSRPAVPQCTHECSIMNEGPPLAPDEVINCRKKKF